MWIVRFGGLGTDIFLGIIYILYLVPLWFSFSVVAFDGMQTLN